MAAARFTNASSRPFFLCPHESVRKIKATTTELRDHKRRDVQVPPGSDRRRVGERFRRAGPRVVRRRALGCGDGRQEGAQKMCTSAATARGATIASRVHLGVCTCT